MNKANQGQDRALATETPFNVINFSNKREGLDPVTSEKEVSAACRLFNVA